MTYQHSSFPVTVTLTSKNGVFLVCELKGSTSEVARERQDLEKRLSSCVLRTLLEAECSSDEVDDTTLSENELVAVSTSHIKLWQRGLISKKCGKAWEILLVDWGMTTDVSPKDVQHLPQQFKAIPYFSQEAVLEGIKPVTLKIDHTIANGPTLAQCLAEEFDEAAQEFIQDKLFGSSETRMTVVYEDKSYLYIRLFLKPKGMDSLFCLNEELCKEGYAVHETSKRVDLGVAQLDEEPNTSYPVSFSDYARSYEKKKKEKEMLALQSLVDSGKMHRSKDPLYAGMQNVSTSQSPSKSPITKSFGRGRLLTMKDGPEVSANLSGSSSTSDVLRAFSPGRNHSSPLSRKYDSDRSSDHSFSMDDELSSSHDLRHTNVTKLDGVSSPYREERLQSVKVSVSDESFSSDVSGRNFSLGRGRKLREPLSQSPKGAQGKHTTSEASAASSKEFMLAQDLLLKSKVTQSTNERLDAVNPSHGKSYFRPDLKRHQEMSQGLHEKPSTPDLSCYPAGMPIKQIAKKSLTSLPLQRERPILPSTGTETGAKPKIECIKKPRNEKFDLCRFQPAITRGAQTTKTQPTTAHPLGENVKRSSNYRAEVFKAALLKVKSPPRHQVMQQESPITPERRAEKLLLSEMTFNIPVAPEQERPVTQIYSDIDAEDLQNTRELLELVSGRSTEISPKKGNSLNFRLSEYVELLKEGKVLVRTPGTFTPSRDLYDIPFERKIHEALEREGIRQPKILQSYVWKAMLDLSHVAFVAGSKTGKTIGYLVPILNSLLDDDLYADIPKGCSPRAIVICPTWTSAELVHKHARAMMTKVPDFNVGLLQDRSPESIQAAIYVLINGMSLLAATAPALLTLLEESQGVINFDRCCHLVFEDADVLLRNHGEVVGKIFERYVASVQRVRSDPKACHMPRQVVACACHWSEGMRAVTKKVLQKPSIFISSCAEAAVYGRMKLRLIRGNKEEMKAVLLQIVKDHRREKKIIFCRDAEEIYEVKRLLQTINVDAIAAHGQSVVPDLNHITYRWDNASPENVILLCTDDILNRLRIQDAQVLIHYFIPHQSKYTFTYRLSFAMGNFHPENPEVPRPESFILMTEEFENSLLGIIRLIERFGYTIQDELRMKAILSYCEKQADKTDLPLCHHMKALGECPDLWSCKKRHVILKDLDQPVLPFKNGMVRIRISAVHSATQYYARILKYCGQDRKLVDVADSGLELEAGIRSHFNREDSSKNSVNAFEIAAGQILAMKSMEGFYVRIRVEEVGEKNQLGFPAEAVVFCLDTGHTLTCQTSLLFRLPDHLKTIPPQAIEIILVGCRPPDKDPSWPLHTVHFVRGKLTNRELDGRIVLALSSTLWLQPLHERRKVEGTNALVVVTDIHKELLGTKRAEKNDDHIKKLYTLAETGGISLSDYSVGIACKKAMDEAEVRYAFLPLLKPVEVQVCCFSSPDQFFVTTVDFHKLINELEADVLKEIGKCQQLVPEEATPGNFCLARFAEKNSTAWYRSCIKSKNAEPHGPKYEVFYVDHGFSTAVHLEDLKMIPKRFVERLPFQAISCSLAGVKPLQGVWTEESIGFANACLKPSNEPQMTVLAESLEKRENTDPETKSPVYSIKLTIPGHQETNACDLATLLVASNYAITTYEETVQLQTSKVEREETAETSTISDEQSARTVYVDEIQEGEQEEENFYDMSPAWYDYIVSSMESRGSTDVQRDEDVKSEVDISRIDSLEEGNIEKENIEEDNREEKCEASDTTDEATSLETPCIVDLHGNDQRTADNQKVVEEILASAIQAITVDTPPCTLPFESDALKENREDSERTSTLIEHIVPLKTADSHFPSTIWYQNGEQVTVTFEIGEVDKYEIEFSPNCFSFAATVNEQRYELKTNTYGSLVPERSSHKKVSSGVLLRLQKRNVGEEWIRLMQSPYRPDWLRRDFSRICEFFNDSDEEENKGAPLVDPKYAFEVDQESTGDSSEFEFSNDSDFEEV